MIRRPTWILVAVFGFLLILTWYLQNRDVGSDADLAPTSVVSPLFAVTEDEISGIRIVARNGLVVEMVRAEDGTGWTMIVPVGEADSEGISEAIRQIAALRIANLLARQPDLSEMGLESPVCTVSVTGVDGSEQVLWIGDLTPTGSGYYAQFAGEPAIVLGKGGVDFLIGLLTEPPILPLEPAGPEPISTPLP